MPTFDAPRKEAFENNVGKEKNAGNQHFFSFQQCFLPYQRKSAPLILSSSNAFNLDKAKILLSCKKLICNSSSTERSKENEGHIFHKYWSRALRCFAI